MTKLRSSSHPDSSMIDRIYIKKWWIGHQQIKTIWKLLIRYNSVYVKKERYHKKHQSSSLQIRTHVVQIIEVFPKMVEATGKWLQWLMAKLYIWELLITLWLRPCFMILLPCKIKVQLQKPTSITQKKKCLRCYTSRILSPTFTTQITKNSSKCDNWN